MTADIAVYRARPRAGGGGPVEPPRDLPRDRAPVQRTLRRRLPGAEGALHADAEGQRHRRPQDVEVLRQHDRHHRGGGRRPREGDGDGDGPGPRAAPGPGQPGELQPLPVPRALLAARRGRGRGPGVPDGGARLRRLQEAPDRQPQRGARAVPRRSARSCSRRRRTSSATCSTPATRARAPWPRRRWRRCAPPCGCRRSRDGRGDRRPRRFRPSRSRPSAGRSTCCCT